MRNLVSELASQYRIDSKRIHAAVIALREKNGGLQVDIKNQQMALKMIPARKLREIEKGPGSFCAWCLAERGCGKARRPISHGVCKRHYKELTGGEL